MSCLQLIERCRVYVHHSWHYLERFLETVIRTIIQPHQQVSISANNVKLSIQLARRASSTTTFIVLIGPSQKYLHLKFLSSN